MRKTPRLRLPFWRSMRYKGPSTANARKRSSSSRRGSSMWWHRHRNAAGRWARVAMALAAAGLLAGCFQPLYGEKSLTGGPGVRERLSSVDVGNIPAPNGTPEARLAVEVRNALIFDLTGGSGINSPTHNLAVRLSTVRQQVIVDITTAR